MVSVSCFGVSVLVMFHFMFVHYTFSSVWVAEWPPFGEKVSRSLHNAFTFTLNHDYGIEIRVIRY